MSDLTVTMRVRNEKTAFPQALVALAEAGKEVPGFKLLICDNDSTDGTEDLLRVPYFLDTIADMGLHDVDLLTMPASAAPGLQGQYENWARMWALFLMKVKTQYMVSLDADVLIPQQGLYAMLSGITGWSSLGGYGIEYPVRPGSTKVHDHVAMGCTIYRTEILRDIGGLNHDKRCQCRWLQEEMEARGWEVRHVPRLRAKHIE